MNRGDIRKRHAAADRGPWGWDCGEDDPALAVFNAETQIIFDEVSAYGNEEANTEFVAHAWQDIGWLLAEVERVKALLVTTGRRLGESIRIMARYGKNQDQLKARLALAERVCEDVEDDVELDIWISEPVKEALKKWRAAVEAEKNE
jgi:hypothetical protein